jgi:hypothetical protein
LAILVIFILAILWAAVLLPPILRSRSNSGSPSGVGDFMARLGSFGRSQQGNQGLPPLQPIMGPIGGNGPVGPSGPVGPGGPVRVPGGMTSAQRRRRDVLVGLLVAAGVTFLMAIVANSIIFWTLHLVVDALLGGFVFLLVQHKRRRSERQTKVRPIHPPVRGVPAPALSQAHIEPPHEAQVLVLRKTASY